MKARLLIVLFLLLCVTPAHATVNEVFARNDYVGNASTTSFPYTFRIINQADVMVLLNSVLQTLNVEYTVLGVDNPGGGAIVFATAPPAGQKVALLRAQRFQQLSIYTPNEAFPAKRIESDLDKNSMVDQRQEEEIGRALKFDPYSLYRNVFVDDPIAGNCLVWNASLTRVASAPCAAGGGGIPGDLTGAGTAGQVTFWTGPAALAGDGKFLWDNSTKALTVGTTPLGGPLKPGNVFIGLQGPANDTGMQTLMVQTHQGAPGLAGLVTLGADRVGISSWNFRGTGATNPIYGANFGVVFNTDGVANGLEIDVQNMTTTPNSGQALWLNGSGTGERANAILIDTQDATKWQRGILFKEGFVANGATGSISGMGIHFERSQDADFIVIQPRVGAAGNVAMKVSNPAFTLNRFELLNSGTLRVSNSMTGPAFPSYSFIEGAGPTAGMYLETVGIAATPPGPGGVPPAVPASGGVLGWSVNSLRRLTLGDALNIWNAGAGANQGGTINFFDPTAVHSVGLMAPDFVGNSFRMKLPTVPGFTGQCLITDAGFPISQLSFAACGTGGGGGGGTVTNTGVLGANQLILGDGGVAIKGMGTLGTATTVLHGNPSGPPIFAGIGPADLSATGTANSTTFLRGDWTWAVPGGSGTVTTSGSPVANQVPFYTSSTVISGDPHFRWSNLGKQLLIGIASDPTSPSQALVVAGATAGSGDGTMQVWGTATGGSPTTNPPVPLTLIGNFNTGSMPTGFGTTLELALRDGVGNAFVSGFINTTAQIISPPTTTIVLGTQVAGVPTPLMSLDTGQALFGRQVTSQVANAINPTGGTFLAAKSYAGGSASANDGLGALIFSGEGVPGVSGTAAQILSNVDATGGSRIKGRLTFHTSDGTSLIERMRITSAGVVTISNLAGSGTVSVSVDAAGTLVRGAAGGVTTTGTPGLNQFAFFSGSTTSITSSPSFGFNSGTGVVSLTGSGSLQIGTPTVARPLTVTSSTPPTRFERSDGATGSGSGTAQQLVHTSSGQMANGFDVQQTFILRDADNVENSVVGLRAYRDAAGGTDNAFGFAIATTSITGLADRITINGFGEVYMGSTIAGAQAAGPLKVGINTPDNVTPYQTILGQTINGSYTPGSITVANDKVAVGGGAYRGAGGTSPIYGGVFQIGFSTTGVSNGVEVGVLNLTGVNGIGNGVWVNGNGYHRDNAILIDTQDLSKWGSGIKFTEGNVGGGATGSILNYGIIFDKSQDQDFIVIRPRVGVTTNRAIRITDVAFSTNKFELWNDGTINTQGFIQTTGNIGAVQYFSSGIGGYSGTKTAGSCIFTLTGGLVTNVTGC